MKNDVEIIESLLASGVIGHALARFISNKRPSVSVVVARAALVASYRARERAKSTNIPILVEEHEVLYEVRSDGSKTWIQDMPKSRKKIAKRFTLK